MYINRNNLYKRFDIIKRQVSFHYLDI